MTTKHTPGNWKVRGQAGYTGHGVDDSTGRSVCSVPSNGNRPYDERNANVRLLAAAPEMLSVLIRAKDAIEALDGTTVENEQLVDDYRTAINKATGG